MEIIRAGMQEAGRAAALAQLLWPGHAQAELEQELAGYLQGPEGAVFLAREDGADVGFAQCGLRRDYVEGTHTSPVGYLEGVFVQEEYRGRGVATALLRACEAWAGEKGCAELQATVGWTTPPAPCFICAQKALPRPGRIICFLKAAVRNVKWAFAGCVDQKLPPLLGKICKGRCRNATFDLHLRLFQYNRK